MFVLNQGRTNPKAYNSIEYRMSQTMANDLLKTRKGDDRNLNPQEYLCKYVNENLGVKGNCVVVTTTL